MPRIVRRRPLGERIKSMLNPMDFLLWLSEEIETREWDSKSVGTQIGLAMNFVFLLARANSAKSENVDDDVFGDGAGRSGWVQWLAVTVVWCLGSFSAFNAVYTIRRTRKYRLFEADIEKPPFATPSAQRVRVQSSPGSAGSPLGFLSGIVGASDSAESRAHPDKERDVWELSIWDPLPVSLRIFCLFSPGHALVYTMFLPLAGLDPQPSVTVFNCLLLQVIMSAQLTLLQSRFAQQAKDTAIIQKEVMHEYDSKFVHPRLYPTVRDASTQLSQDGDHGRPLESVQVGTTMTVLRRGFRTQPNQNYAKHFDPDGVSHAHDVRARPSTANTLKQQQSLFTTPPLASRQSDVFTSSTHQRAQPSTIRRSSNTPGMASSLVNPRQSHLITSTTQTSNPTQLTKHQPPVQHTPHNYPRHLQASTQKSVGTGAASGGAGGGVGGYMGIYTHPSSPLKKTPSLGELNYRSPRTNAEMAHLEQYRERSVSPLKHGGAGLGGRRSAGTATGIVGTQEQGWEAASNARARGRSQHQQFERYPSMWGR